MDSNPLVDAYLARATRWPEEMALLRAMLLEAGLDEDFKWAKPCYTLGGTNLILILSLSPHVALLFTAGSLLPDPDGILVQPTENTNAARQLRLTSANQIREMAPVLRAYIDAAIEVERSGQKIDKSKSHDYELAEELVARMDADPALSEAFHALTPGRQRGYNLHISGAKQSATRSARVDRCVPMILAGKGLNDR